MPETKTPTAAARLAAELHATAETFGWVADHPTRRAASLLLAQEKALRETTGLLELALNYLDENCGPWELEGEPGFDDGSSRRLVARARSVLRFGEEA